QNIEARQPTGLQIRIGKTSFDAVAPTGFSVPDRLGVLAVGLKNRLEVRQIRKQILWFPVRASPVEHVAVKGNGVGIRASALSKVAGHPLEILFPAISEGGSQYGGVGIDALDDGGSIAGHAYHLR